MPSAFVPCRACGKPVYVGAKRCPSCRAPTSWRGHLRSNSLPLLILALLALFIVGVALYEWADQTKSGASNRDKASGLPAPPAAAGNRSAPLYDLPLTVAGAGGAGAAQTLAALKQRYTEYASAITVRGKRIEPGMSADSLFELASERDLLGQTMEPDPGNPGSLQFVKYYRIDKNEFAVELRKPSLNAPYTVTSILVERSGDRASANQ